MTATCPSCGCSQPEGLLCHEDTAAVETMLAAVPALLEQLQVAIANQAKTGSGGKAGKGSIHERSPINWGVVAVRDTLVAELAVWGDDIPALRRNPDAGKAVSRISTAVKHAYRIIDRAQERQYLGQCLYEEDGLTCHAELWARLDARQVTCSQCGISHDVAERRAWLLHKSGDMLFTVKEAARTMGSVGHIKVTEASIRGYIHRGKIGYRTGKLIRLGDLLAVVVDESERRTA